MAYSGLLTVTTMLENLGSLQLVEETVTIKRRVCMTPMLASFDE